VIEPLGKHHHRAAFSCGQPDLDDWFRRRARQDAKRIVARVFVAVEDELGVIGYGLSSFALSIRELPGGGSSASCRDTMRSRRGHSTPLKHDVSPVTRRVR
jgi:hypothetical protein